MPRDRPEQIELLASFTFPDVRYCCPLVRNKSVRHSLLRMHLTHLLLQHPVEAVIFSYTFAAQSFIVLLKRTLLPHISQYQSVRIQLHRAYLSACSATFPDLTHRLPVGPVPDHKARQVGTDFTGYIIPGYKDFKTPTAAHQGHGLCAILYAHGGGYARGEAKMYINYMERWEREAAKIGLDIVFLSVEYRE